MPVPNRLRVSPESCWLWAKALTERGNGRFTYYGKSILAHRAMYEYVNGPIPEGLELNHLCKIPACINPEHLEAVTHAENVWYSMPYGQGYCKRGHTLAGDNLYTALRYAPTGRVTSQCKTCSDNLRRDRYYKNKQKGKTE